ncbi:MAG: lysylphosphatidylglycerol synthase transmembrane domain-containing protein [Elusimicrobiota bacterium]
MKNDKWLFALKGAFCLFLLIHVLGKARWTDFREALASADAVFMALSFLLGPAVLHAGFLRWRAFLKIRETGESFWALFELYLAGRFLNFLRPYSAFGHWEFEENRVRWRAAAASTALDRFLGLSVLLSLSLAGLALNAPLFLNRALSASLAAVLVGFFIVLWAALAPRSPLTTWKGRLPGPVLRVVELRAAFQAWSGRRGLWVRAAALTLLCALLAAIDAWAACRAFGAHVPFTILLAAAPLVQVIAMAPVSLGNAGLQEWGYFFVFKSFGLPPELGLAVALLLRARGLATGLGAGALYLRWVLKNIQPVPAGAAFSVEPSTPGGRA